MPPFADAVGLVHHQPGGTPIGPLGPKLLSPQHFGGHVQEAELAGGEGLERSASDVPRRCRCQLGCGQTPAPERVHLVLHERYERADDQRGSGSHQGRELKADGLPRTGWEDGEYVAPQEHGVDDRPLEPTKSRVAVETQKRGLRRLHAWTGRAGRWLGHDDRWVRTLNDASSGRLPDRVSGGVPGSGPALLTAR